jgi:5-methylcytosine-specific restriction endonuclease McrA
VNVTASAGLIHSECSVPLEHKFYSLVKKRLVVENPAHKAGFFFCDTLIIMKSEAAKAAGRRYYERNKEAVMARAAARPAEVKQAYRNAHKKRNPEVYKALTSARKRRHREATPKWITKEQKLEIRGLYLKAIETTRITGERYVVDHIVPLINDAVCGLHVPWNLQVITQQENLVKSNKLV